MKEVIYTYGNMMHPVINKVTLPPGKWKLECQGGYGGMDYNEKNGETMDSSRCSDGGYAKGEVTFYEPTTLYCRVGTGNNIGTSNPDTAGGSAEGKSEMIDLGNNKYRTIFHGAGGATEFRYLDSKQDDEAGMNSRIIVAGGAGVGPNMPGGGITAPVFNPDGGGVEEFTSATQSSPGTYNTLSGYNGFFGLGGLWRNNPNDIKERYLNPGGGGWYGGAGGPRTTYNSYNNCSAGGSGYVLTADSYKPEGYNPPSKYYMTNVVNRTGAANIAWADKTLPYAKVTLLDTIGPTVSSPNASDLGTISINDECKFVYTIVTQTESTVTVIEKLNDEIINTKNLQAGTHESIIDKSKILPLTLDSSNTITVEVSDSADKKSTQTFTFIKGNVAPNIEIVSFDATTVIYSVSDQDNNLSKIEILLDDVVIETITEDLYIQKTSTYSLPDNSIHIIKIKATDSKDIFTIKALNVSKNIMPLQDDATLEEIANKSFEIKNKVLSDRDFQLGKLELSGINVTGLTTFIDIGNKIEEALKSSDATVENLQNIINEKNTLISQLNDTINNAKEVYSVINSIGSKLL